MCKFQQKIDKMWISDWGTVVRQKLEKVSVLSNVCCNFEKKLVEYSEKRRDNFENVW